MPKIHRPARGHAICRIRPLPPARRLDSIRLAQEIDPQNLPDGLTPDIALADTGSRLALDITKYWGKQPRKLTVGFIDGESAPLRKRILGHMNAWSSSICIKFVASSQDPQVRIARYTREEAPDWEGYWSLVGTDILTAAPDEPTMNLEGFTMKTSEAEFRRVVRHEAGHTLGFEHEHMRREIIARLHRERTIAYFMRTQGWKRKEVIDQVLRPLEEASIIGSDPADPTSIMCYEMPAEITKDGVEIIGGTDITAADRRFAAEVYPPTASKRSPAEPAAAAPRMHVLLIGIDAYPSNPLSGCVNDIDAVQDLLIRRLGVPASAIRRLTAPRDRPGAAGPPDERPTRENLLRAFAALASDDVRPGDRVFIYYAGHGTTVQCQGARGGRFSREALLAVDHRGHDPRYLFDWELSDLVANIAARTPAVSFVLDACCSAGATRELAVRPGKDRYYPESTIYTVPSGGFEPGRERGRGVLPGLAARAGSAAVVAACLTDERARESEDADGQRHGEFTQALLAALRPIADPELAALRWGQIWRTLVATVVSSNPTQHPWISCAEIRKVFGGAPEDGDPGYAVTTGRDGFHIDAGSLSGVTAGAEIAVYPALGSFTAATRLGVVRVTSAELARADAVPVAPFPALPDGARGRLLTAGEAARVRVAVRPHDARLVASLEHSGLLSMVAAGEPADLIIARRRDGAWALTDEVFGAGDRPGEATLPIIPAGDHDRVLRCVEHYARFTAPLRLARGCRDLPRALQIRLLACPTASVPPELAQDPPFTELPAGEHASYDLHAGDAHATRFCIRVENTSALRLYISLLHCSSAAKVSVLHSNDTLEPGAFKVLWLPTRLRAPFVATLAPGQQIGIDRLIAVGTTDANASLHHLALTASLADLAEGKGSRDFGAAHETGGAWTATIVTVRVTTRGAPARVAPLAIPLAAAATPDALRGIAVRNTPIGMQVVPFVRPDAAVATRSERLAATSPDLLASTIAAEDLDLIADLALVPTDEGVEGVARGLDRGPASDRSDTLRFDLPVADDEGAVVLVEHDGVNQWILPEHPRLGASLATFDLAPTAALDPSVRGERWFSGLRIRVYRFLARKAIAAFEARQHEGLVHITSPATADWRPVDPRELPSGARVLLLIHGTFSSTLGGFGGLALGHTRHVLARAIADGDLVLGYDHPTLGKSPRDNADDLYHALRWAGLVDRPLRIVCHSRGGLVARCLADLLARHGKPPVAQVLSVATADHGTQMAAPGNWQQFANMLTNLATATSSEWAGVVGGAIAAGVMTAAVGGVVALIRELAVSVLDEALAPGLTAMTPDGPFLAALPAWSATAVGERRVLVSNFAASGVATRGPGGDVALDVLDRLADRLFAGEANDLVVDNASSEHQLAGEYVERLPASARIHHLNFFGSPALARWLEQHLHPARALRRSELRATGNDPPDPPFHLFVQVHAPIVVGPCRRFWISVDLSAAPHPGPDERLDLQLVVRENAVVGSAASAAILVPSAGGLVRVGFNAEARIPGRVGLQVRVDHRGDATRTIDVEIVAATVAPGNPVPDATFTAAASGD